MSPNEFSLCKLADVLNRCGDYNYQVKILETIFNLYSANQINECSRNCFPESEVLQNAFRRIPSGNFNFNVRRFLNLINCDSNHVASIKCERVMLDAIWVGAPKGCIEHELWVDFNEGSKTISILCDVESLRSSCSCGENNSNTEAWESIVVNAADVQNVILSRWLDVNYPNSIGAVICFNLTNPCSVLYASSKKTAQAKQLKLAVLNGSALQRLEKIVLPTMFMRNFKKLSPSCTVQQPQQQKMGIGENSRSYGNEPQMSIGCDKEPVNVVSLRQYHLNSMSFGSAMDEHLNEPCTPLDEPCTPLDETTLKFSSHSDFRHRANANNQRNVMSVGSLLDEAISVDSQSVASTHLTDCVLDYIDLTLDDMVQNLSSHTIVQSPQSEQYYSIPEDNTTAAVVDLTCVDHNEFVQPQSNAAAVYSEQYYSIPENNTISTVVDLTYVNHNESAKPHSERYYSIPEDNTIDLTYVDYNEFAQPQGNVIKSQYFTANEAVFAGTARSQYFEPVIVENRPLRKLLSIIEEEGEVQLESNSIQYKPPEMNKTDLDVSCPTTKVNVSVGECTENVSKMKKKSPTTITRRNIEKFNKTAKNPVQNQFDNEDGDKTQSPEDIFQHLLPNFGKLTPRQPKEKILETETNQDDEEAEVESANNSVQYQRLEMNKADLEISPSTTEKHQSKKVITSVRKYSKNFPKKISKIMKKKSPTAKTKNIEKLHQTAKHQVKNQFYNHESEAEEPKERVLETKTNQDDVVESTSNNVQYQPLEMNETNLEISPSTAVKHQSKKVSVSVGKYSKNFPKKISKIMKKKSPTAKTKNIEKLHETAKHQVKNQFYNHESDKTKSPEDIFQQLLPDFEKLTAEEPKERVLETKTNQDDVVESTSNNVQYQPLEMNKTNLEISPSTAVKHQSKKVSVSVGKYSENVPKIISKRKIMIKKSSTTKTKNIKKLHNTAKRAVKNQLDNHESSEDILEELLSNCEEVTVKHPEDKVLATKTNEAGVHLGSFESANKGSKQLKKRIRKKPRSENLNEVTSETLLLSKRARVVFNRLVPEETVEENQIHSGVLVVEEEASKMNEVEQIEKELVATTEDQVVKDNVQTLITENPQILSFVDKHTQKITHQNFDLVLKPKKRLKKIEEPTYGLIIDENHNETLEKKTESILTNSLVNSEEKVAEKDHQDVFAEPSPNVIESKQSGIEGHTEKSTKFEDHGRIEPVIKNVENRQFEYPNDIEECNQIQEERKDHGLDEHLQEKQQSLNIDQSYRKESANNFPESLPCFVEEVLRNEDREEQQNQSGKINKLVGVLKNMQEEISKNDNGQNSHLEEDKNSSKQNLKERDQFDFAANASRDDPLSTEEDGKLQKQSPKNLKTNQIQTEDLNELCKKIAYVKLVRLNMTKDTKTEIIKITNTQKCQNVGQWEKNKKYSNTKTAQPPLANSSMILTPSNNENRLKSATKYDVHTEQILSQSRKYCKRNCQKPGNKENLESFKNQNKSHVRKLYNPHDLSYTKLFNEDDFDEKTSVYFKSAIENPMESRSSVNLGFNHSSTKKAKSVKGDKIAKKTRKIAKSIDENLQKKNNKIKHTEENSAQNNNTFRWKLKKQMKENEARNRKENIKRTRVARNEHDENLGQSGNKRKQDMTMFSNTLGKTIRKKRKEDENLDPFDSILTNEERNQRRKLAQLREELAISKKSLNLTTYQSEGTSKSHVFDFMTIFDNVNKTYNTTISNRSYSGRNKKSYKNDTAMRGKKLKPPVKPKKLYHVDNVIRKKNPSDGDESLYSDVERPKLPVKNRKSKSFHTIEKEQKPHRYTQIVPILSKTLHTTAQIEPQFSQNKQNSSELSPLPELNFENEMEPLSIESEPRLTSSNSTEPAKLAKINILSIVTVKPATNYNIVQPLAMDKEPSINISTDVCNHGASKETELRNFSQTSTVVIPSEILKVASKNITSEQTQKIPKEKTIGYLSIIEELQSATHNLSAVASEMNRTGSTNSRKKITPTNEEILNWVPTGLSQEAAEIVKNILEIALRSFRDMITQLLQAIHGPIPSNLVDLYKLLTKLEKDFNNYFN